MSVQAASVISDKVSFSHLGYSDTILLFRKTCEVLTKFEYYSKNNKSPQFDDQLHVAFFRIIVEFRIPLHILYPDVAQYFHLNGLPYNNIIHSEEWLRLTHISGLKQLVICLTSNLPHHSFKFPVLKNIPDYTPDDKPLDEEIQTLITDTYNAIQKEI